DGGRSFRASRASLIRLGNEAVADRPSWRSEKESPAELSGSTEARSPVREESTNALLPEQRQRMKGPEVSGRRDFRHSFGISPGASLGVRHKKGATDV